MVYGLLIIGGISIGITSNKVAFAESVKPLTNVQTTNSVRKTILPITGTKKVSTQRRDQDEVITFQNNTNLKHAINEALQHDKDADITKSQLEEINTLDLSDKAINNIKELKFCTKLERLKLGPLLGAAYKPSLHNTVSDLTPLHNLTNLKYLILNFNSITNFKDQLKPLYPQLDFSNSFKTLIGKQETYQTVQANKDGSYQLVNPCVDLEGKAVEPTDTDGGTYDPATNTISWTSDEIKQHHSTGGSGDESGEKIYSVETKFNFTDPNNKNIEIEVGLGVTVKSNGKRAEDAITSLYKNNDPTKWALADKVTSKDIQDAQDNLNDVTDADEITYKGQKIDKAELTRWFFKANLMFLKKQETLSLFKGNDATADKLADGVTQDTITKTKKDIEDNIPAEMSKADAGTRSELLGYVNRAQQLFDAQSSQPAGNGDFDTNGIIDLQQGPITLNTNNLPKSIDFNPNEIRYDKETSLSGKATPVSGPEAGDTKIEVTDCRGTKSGWNLELKQVNDFKAKDGKSLGAQLSIETNQVTNDRGTVPTGGIGGDVPQGSTTKTTTLAPGQVVTLLEAKAPQTTPTATEGEGDGISKMDIVSYNLAIPGNAPKEATNYSTQLEWTFSDTVH